MLDLTPFVDEDGYPTKEAEAAIKGWTGTNGSGSELFSAIKAIWKYAEWGWDEAVVDDELDLHSKPKRKACRYYISTAGWSGNETLISAMQENFIFWAMFWVQSRRGGHYVFEVPLRNTE